MKINTALILCAGFGKRLNPITLTKPKPLLKIKEVTMLEKSINLIKEMGINKIFINTFYLKEHFLNFIKNESLESLWMDTNLMCMSEKTSSILNEIKWKKIFLFNPGEEEFLLYKI